MERACHEGVVLGHVAERDDLGRADAVVGNGHLGDGQQNVGHAHHGVHVDARPGGRHVDRRAHAPGAADGFGDGLDERRVAARHALLDHAAEAADEIDADLFGGGVERVRHLHVGGGVVAAHHMSDGRQRHPAIDDRDAVLLLDLVRYAHQAAGVLHDLRVDALRGAAWVAFRAVEERDAHGDRPDVEVLGPDHVDCLEDLLLGDEDHGAAPEKAADAARRDA